MDDRERAQQWLAERLREGDHAVSRIGECGREEERQAIAAAILATAGVEVAEEAGWYGHSGTFYPAQFADGVEPRVRRLVIRLPAEAMGEDR